MAKIWLPVNKFVVREAGRERTVIIPATGDPSYDAYLEEAEREKTAEQLRKLPPRPSATMSKEQVAGLLKDYIEFINRKKRGEIRRFY